MKKLLLPTIWILSLTGIFFLTSSFQKNTTRFYGLTDNQGQAVSFDEPVEITEINVIEGQHVEIGSILLKARRSELDAQQTQLNGQIDEIKARHNQITATLKAEIRVLNIQKRSDLAKIDMQIQQLNAERKLNYDLYEKIIGNTATSSDIGVDLLLDQIQSLKKQKEYLTNSVQAQVAALRTQIAVSGKPALVQKNQITASLNELNRKAKELIIRADFTGRIGGINFKQGERIPSFTSILTVHGLYPKFIKGYIHENVSNDVKMGQQVWVHAMSHSKDHKTVRGIVESLGSRIVTYPTRLKKSDRVQSWGREVVIRLEDNNPLLLGEKVEVSFSSERPNTIEAFFKPLGEKAESYLPTTVAFGGSKEGE